MARSTFSIGVLRLLFMTLVASGMILWVIMVPSHFADDMVQYGGRRAGAAAMSVARAPSAEEDDAARINSLKSLEIGAAGTAGGGQTGTVMDAAAPGGAGGAVAAAGGGGPFRNGGMNNNNPVVSQQQMQKVKRMIAQTVEMEASVPNGALEPAIQEVHRITSDAEGYVSYESTSFSSRGNAVGLATFRLKIPSFRLPSVVEELAHVGRVNRMARRGTEVSAEIVNHELVLSTAQSELRRFEDLYRSAGTIEEKLALLEKLMDYQRTVKSLEETLRRLKLTVDYATISMSLTEMNPDPATKAVSTSPEEFSSLTWRLASVLVMLAGISFVIRAVHVAALSSGWLPSHSFGDVLLELMTLHESNNSKDTNKENDNPTTTSSGGSNNTIALGTSGSALKS